jgi:hypothetical protein
MHTREQALHASPGIWGLTAIGAVATIGAVAIVVWNVWERIRG